jgi:hypothetical protein
MGDELAESYGRRNAVPPEMVIRVSRRRSAPRSPWPTSWFTLGVAVGGHPTTTRRRARTCRPAIVTTPLTKREVLSADTSGVHRPRSIAATSSTSSIRSRAGELTSWSARTAPSDAASSLVDLRVSAGQRWLRRCRHGAGRDALPRSGLELLRRPVRRRVGSWSNRGW